MRVHYYTVQWETFEGENFRELHKSVKFAKVFSLESFPLYGSLSVQLKKAKITWIHSYTALQCVSMERTVLNFRVSFVKYRWQKQAYTYTFNSSYDVYTLGLQSSIQCTQCGWKFIFKICRVQLLQRLEVLGNCLDGRYSICFRYSSYGVGGI